MGIGIGLVLLTIGAILLWAVEASIDGLNVDVVGIILLITGGVGLLWGVMTMSRSRREAVGD